LLPDGRYSLETPFARSSSVTDAARPREGSLRRVLLVRDRRTNESWGYGFAEFAGITVSSRSQVAVTSGRGYLGSLLLIVRGTVIVARWAIQFFAEFAGITVSLFYSLLLWFCFLTLDISGCASCNRRREPSRAPKLLSPVVEATLDPFF
jgi:hypothetical protein